ncbi:Conserved_hypothetical protein [Hexamita inflata]|uniref:ARID domain-containing protein n=1 Tax=Hexamita inflata TaxID=28002 RepID=A0AA86TTT4_9EUKA|nr:Conserved hypothetical protein [Hexamita inflata]
MDNNVFSSPQIWVIAKKMCQDDPRQLKFYADLFQINFKYLSQYQSEWPTIANQQVDLLALFKSVVANGGFFNVFKKQQFQSNLHTAPLQQNPPQIPYFGLPEVHARPLVAECYLKNLLLFEQLYLGNGTIQQNLIAFIRQFSVQPSLYQKLKLKQQVNCTPSDTTPIRATQEIISSRDFMYKRLNYSAQPVLESKTMGNFNQFGNQQVFTEEVQVSEINHTCNQLQKQFAKYEEFPTISNMNIIIKSLIQLQNYLIISEETLIKSSKATILVFERLETETDEQVLIILTQILQQICYRFKLNDNQLILNDELETKIDLVKLKTKLDNSPDLIQCKLRLMANLISRQYNRWHQLKKLIDVIDIEHATQFMYWIIKKLNVENEDDVFSDSYTFQCCFALLRSTLTFEKVEEGIFLDALTIVIELYNQVKSWVLTEDSYSGQAKTVIQKSIFDCIEDLRKSDLFDQIGVVVE